MGQEIYKWYEKDGTVRYSTWDRGDAAKPEELRPIVRKESPVRAGLLQSCSRRGGINCGAGPDTDGSVICYDGFRDAAPRFRFSCSSPKLSASEVLPGENGTFVVVLRNSNGVTASGVKVAFKQGGKKMPLAGPADIEPFGVGEYEPPRGAPLNPPKLSEIELTCANCP